MAQYLTGTAGRRRDGWVSWFQVVITYLHHVRQCMVVAGVCGCYRTPSLERVMAEELLE